MIKHLQDGGLIDMFVVFLPTFCHLIIKDNRHATSQLQTSQVYSKHGLLYAVFYILSPHHMGFLRVLWFPPSSQNHGMDPLNFHLDTWVCVCVCSVMQWTGVSSNVNSHVPSVFGICLRSTTLTCWRWMNEWIKIQDVQFSRKLKALSAKISNLSEKQLSCTIPTV